MSENRQVLGIQELANLRVRIVVDAAATRGHEGRGEHGGPQG